MGTWKFSNEIEMEICSAYVSGYSIRKIAGVFSASKNAVRNVLIKYNIKRRKNTCGNHANTPILLENKLLEIIQGHLLGDGCLYKPKAGINYYFSLTSKYENYAKLVAKNMELLKPSETKRDQRHRWGKILTYYFFQTKSLVSPELHKKWYPNNIKIIPDDLILTPITCLFWYIDDGGLDSKGDIKLCTHSFTKENQEEILIPQLKKILGCTDNSVKIRESRRYFYVHIPRRYTKRFLEYIGKCPTDCYKYKWYLKPYKNKKHKYL